MSEDELGITANVESAHAIGDMVDCTFCGDVHEVIGHFGPIALMGCPAIGRGEYGVS